MRIRKFALLVACALMIGALVPATATAAFSNYQGSSADAWSSSWNWDNGEPGPDDAVDERSVSGWMFSSVWKDGKQSAEIVKDLSGAVWMNSYTPATGDQPPTWTEFNCFSMDPAFTLGKRLSSASLQFMAPVEIRIWRGSSPWVEEGYDFYQREPDEVIDAGMVSVMAEWKPSGALTRSNYLSRERSTEFSYSDRTNQSYRDATADVSVVGADGTIYWSDALMGSIYQSKGVSRFPADF